MLLNRSTTATLISRWSQLFQVLKISCIKTNAWFRELQLFSQGPFCRYEAEMLLSGWSSGWRSCKMVPASVYWRKSFPETNLVSLRKLSRHSMATSRQSNGTMVPWPFDNIFYENFMNFVHAIHPKALCSALLYITSFLLRCNIESLWGFYARRKG